MGTCCFGNRPSEKFVGVWSDDQHVQLVIEESGRIHYKKQSGSANTDFMGPSRFTDDKFLFCYCCCCLRGQYTIDEDSQPKLIANGTVLTKRN